MKAQKQFINAHRPKRVLTWHVHGSYLYYLVQAPFEFYLPVKADRSEGYGGASGSFPWGDNVHEVPAEEVKNLDLDCVIYQSRRNYLQDRFEILSEEQQALPRIYLEHDPPREHPTDTRHLVNDPNTLLVHVTYFNQLMWDSGLTPTQVIPHGVLIPDDARYSGEYDRGIVVVNNMANRGRRLGADIFEAVRKEIPLDLVGMNSKEMGGLGEIALKDLQYYETKYRFFFNPIRYTSLGLAVCEAMMAGMPIIGLATTEMAKTIENGVSGFVDTDIRLLVEWMKELCSNPGLAKQLGDCAQIYAREHFNIQRFIRDWNTAMEWVAENSTTRAVL